MLALVPKVLMSMLSSLMTEKFLKWAVVYAVELVVKRTKTQEDDVLLAKCKEQWGL